MLYAEEHGCKLEERCCIPEEYSVILEARGYMPKGLVLQCVSKCWAYFDFLKFLASTALRNKKKGSLSPCCFQKTTKYKHWLLNSCNI